MTSVDSGVETGNDSNDSSITQHENLHNSTVPINNVTVMTNTNNNPLETGISTKRMFSLDESSLLCLPEDQSKVYRLPQYLRFPVIEKSDLQHNNENSASSSRSMKIATLPTAIQINASDLVKQLKLPWVPAVIRKDRISCSNRFRAAARKNYLCWKDMQSPYIQRKMRLAAATNNIMLMHRLLETGVSPNNHDEHGRTPLHHASCRGYTEMVEMLLRFGANPNIRDCVGNTPLHLAAVTSKIAVVTLLLTAGTNVSSLDHHGYNPLQLAQTKLRLLQSYKDSDMVKIKEEMCNIVNMLLAYLRKQESLQGEMESLTNFCSRLSLSNTSNQVQDDVKDLLASVTALNIKS